MNLLYIQFHMYKINIIYISNLLALPISVLFVCTKQSVSQEEIWSPIQIYSIYTCPMGEVIDWLSVVVIQWQTDGNGEKAHASYTNTTNNILPFDWSCLSTTHNYKITNIIVVCLSMSNRRSAETI